MSETNNVLQPSEVYDSSIRIVTVLFGSLFDDISVRTYLPDGNVSPVRHKVPLSYSNKQAYELWMEQRMRMPDGTIEVGRFLPRISYEMTDISMDTESKLNPLMYHLKANAGTAATGQKMRAPAAYRFGFGLSVWCKQMDDSIQILDQILTVFNPELSLKMYESKNLCIINDVKVVLNSVSKNDNYQDGLSDNRMIEWSFSFDVFANIVPSEENASVIRKAIINMNNHANEILEAYTADGRSPDFMVEENLYSIDDEIPEEDVIK